MPTEGNGKSAFAIAFIIFEVIIISILGFMTNQAFVAYRELCESDKCLLEKYDDLRQVSNDCMHKIDLRLSRIESKLNIPSS